MAAELFLDIVDEVLLLKDRLGLDGDLVGGVFDYEGDLPSA